MTDQTNTELSDQEKAVLAEEEKKARMWVRIQQEEAAVKAREDDVRRIGSMSDEQFKRFTRENWGF